MNKITTFLINWILACIATLLSISVIATLIFCIGSIIAVIMDMNAPIN